MAHTILLLQPSADPDSRTYCDYETVGECIEGVCKIYEQVLRQRESNAQTITYDISQLFGFIDQFTDFCCMVYQPSTNSYAPQNKRWVKEKIYQLMKQAAGMSSTPIIKRHERSVSSFRGDGDGAEYQPPGRDSRGAVHRRTM